MKNYKINNISKYVIIIDMKKIEQKNYEFIY
jgi:hypothetical protein